MKFSRTIKRVIGRISKIFRKKGSKKAPKKRLPGGSRRAPELIEASKNPVLQLPHLPQISPIQSLREFAELQLSANTQRAYRKDLQDFFSWLKTEDFYENWNQNLGPAQVAQYREHLRVERNLSKSTVTRRLAVLKSFFKYACAQGWMLRNPAELVKGFPQNQDSKTGFLNEAQIRQVLAFLRNRGDERLSQQLQRVGVETLLMLGLRRSEACSIRLGHLEYLDSQWLVRVQGKGDRERLLPLPTLLLESWSKWLQRIHRQDCPSAELSQNPVAWIDFLKRHASLPLLISSRAKSFDTALSSAELAFIVRKVARLSGLANRVSPHMLRASAITFALDQGASHRAVQQMAGWTSPLMITRYDKRRNDPKLSAVHNLRYAQEAEEPSSSP